jgi:hypothetical protein
VFPILDILLSKLGRFKIVLKMSVLMHSEKGRSCVTESVKEVKNKCGVPYFFVRVFTRRVIYSRVHAESVVVCVLLLLGGGTVYVPNLCII